VSEPGSEKRFFLVQTNEFERLVDCVSYAMFGVTLTFFKKRGRPFPSLQRIRVGDQVFIRLQVSPPLIFGTFTVTAPPPQIVVESQMGNWYEVNLRQTPRHFLPGWIEQYRLCIFFDPLLMDDVRCLYEHECLGLAKGFGEIANAEQLYERFVKIGRGADEFLANAIVKQKHAGAAEVPPRTFKTKRGVMVRSKSELIIDDWLYDHRIRAEYERSLNLSGTTVKPDWYLPDAKAVLEHLGLSDDESYRKAWEQKRRLYEQNGIRVVTTSEQDVRDLDIALSRKLRPFFRTLL
jgi:hypothetical protein